MNRREGFNIDKSLEVPGLGGGTPDVLGNLKHARGIRIIGLGIGLTGNATLQVYWDGIGAPENSIFMRVGDFDKNGVMIWHVRGTRTRGVAQDWGYQLNPNSGTATISPTGGIYLELLDY